MRDLCAGPRRITAGLTDRAGAPRTRPGCCDNGTCVVDLCDGVFCDGASVCDPASGQCVGDMCENLHCEDVEACNPFTGECIDDPCLQIDCPAGLECVLEPDGAGTCREPVRQPDETITTGGGGCQSSGGDGSWLLGLGLVGLLARRRRRRAADMTA